MTRHAEGSDVARAGVDGVHGVTAHRDRALRSEARARAEPAGGKRPGRDQMAIGGSVERQDGVAGGAVGLREHAAGVGRRECGGGPEKGGRGECRDGERSGPRTG